MTEEGGDSLVLLGNFGEFGDFGGGGGRRWWHLGGVGGLCEVRRRRELGWRWRTMAAQSIN